jgi:hypothetical protein
MRVLVGPVMKNKALKDDYCCTERGEILFSWDCPCSDPGCDRHSFSGTHSHMGSMFAEVAERADMTDQMLIDLFTDHIRNTGLSVIFDADEIEEMAHEELALCKTLQFLRPGEIVARTPDGVYVPEQFRDPAKIVPLRPKVSAA